ncbi:MAG: PAS-domain containing protein [Halieaceae bacterium]
MVNQVSDNSNATAQGRERPALAAHGWWLLIAILLLGGGATATLSQWFHDDAQKTWESHAAQAEQWLSGAVLAWLEESYAPISGIAILFENSDLVTEDEFLLSVDALEARATTVFIDTVASVRRADAGAQGRWVVQFSNYLDDSLTPGALLPDDSVIVEAVDTAISRPGRIVLGAPFHTDTETQYLPVILALSDAQGELAIVGLMNFEALVAGLYETHSPTGVSLRAEGRFPTPSGPGSPVHFFGEPTAETIYSSTSRTVSAGADLSLSWDFGAAFEGGPHYGLPRAVAAGGGLLTLLMALFAYVMLAQAGRIRREVITKTAALKRQTDIVNLALQNMGEGILLVDDRGEVAAYNQLAATYFGVTEEEIQRFPDYEDLLRYIYTEKFDQPEALEERLQELQQTDATTTDRALPNGRMLEVRHHPVAGGGFVRVFLDVTENREAQDELKRQTAIADQALENIDEGLLMVGADGNLLAGNQYALELSGLTREEFEAFETYEEMVRFVHGERLDTPEMVEQRLADARATEVTITELLHPDGRVLEARHIPMSDGGFVRMFTNITERKQSEAALEEQRAIADLALQTMDEGLLLVDGEGLIKAWNDIAVEIFEITAETMAGFDKFADLLHHLMVVNVGSTETYDSELAEAMENLPSVLERLLPDGRIIQTRHIPIDAGGFVRIFSDVTQRRAEEEELIAARQVAEDSARSKAEFLANMSHEIRTPMNAIIGMSQLSLKTELTPKQHNYIDKVHRSAVGLLGIINDILDFSKIEAGKLEIETIDFRLEDVLDNLVNLVGLRAEEKGLELLLNVDADVPRLLVGDPLRLGQVLINIGNNAIKFTEEGEVVVAVRALERTGDSVRLQFSVKDSGIGMSVEQKARLFQAFSQADASTTRKFGGTGLGLTISKRLVDAMGGEIIVDSKPDMGSTFSFELELDWKESDEPLPRADELELSGLRVLAVDDNPTARTILEDLVTSMGFNVDLAADGKEALGMAEQASEQGEPYSVILMDWRMPGLDGVDTTRELVTRGLLDDTQALMMVTAYGREDASTAGADLPISDFLTKPLSASTLLDSILIALGREAVSRRHLSQSEEQNESTLKLAGAYVLLVEDNDINQELALDLLTAADIVVDIANHGGEALEMLKANEYDGVLMDIQMPVMDGYTAAEKIRSQPQYENLPVIAMTANALVGDREMALEVGMNDHIAKPLNVSEMFATMARWITPSDPSRRPQRQGEASDNADGMPALKGVDTRAGLGTCAGNLTLYRKLLLKFVDANTGFEQEFRKAQSSEDEGAATRCAHTLKGVAASIGAGEVRVAASELELACRDADALEVIDARLQAVLKSLNPVLAEIAAAGIVQPLQTGAGDTEAVAALAEELRPLLESADTRAGEVAEQLLASLPEDHREPLERLIAQLELFDFDAALAIFAEAEQQLLETEDL